MSGRVTLTAKTESADDADNEEPVE